MKSVMFRKIYLILKGQQKNRIYKRTCLKQATSIKSVANTVYFLLSDDSLSITGQNIFVDSGTMIHLDPNSEIYITVSNISKNFDLLYGSMFIHNSSGSSTDSYIFTLTSRAIIKDAKVWINRDVSSGRDEFFCLDEIFVYIMI